MIKGSFFQTPFFLSLTIGIPFCIYKILFGFLAVRVGGSLGSVLLQAVGYVIIIWACADLLMNLIRAILDLNGNSNRIEFCTLAQIGRFLKAPAVLLALDTVITFTIISFVLWSGWIVYLSKFESYFWSFATTLNLISLSLVVLYNELVRFKDLKKE